MNLIKINIVGVGTYTYWGQFPPRVGDSINWTAQNIVGTVASATWERTNEITLDVVK